MRYAYPCQITRYADDDVVVSFPDVTGANTSGKDRNEALEMAGDALATALAMYVHKRLSVPVPSQVMGGQEIVTVDRVTAARLALYSAMREQGITKRTLANRPELSETTAGRLTGPSHRSRIGNLVEALGVVGRRLVVEGRSLAVP